MSGKIDTTTTVAIGFVVSIAVGAFICGSQLTGIDHRLNFHDKEIKEQSEWNKTAEKMFAKLNLAVVEMSALTTGNKRLLDHIIKSEQKE